MRDLYDQPDEPSHDPLYESVAARVEDLPIKDVKDYLAQLGYSLAGLSDAEVREEMIGYEYELESNAEDEEPLGDL